MQITFDTTELTAEDREVLAVYASKAAPTAKAATPPKPVTSKAAKAPESEVEEEIDLGLDSAPTTQDAIDRATVLVGEKKAQKVKDVLADLGVERVSVLEGDDIVSFLAALADA